MDNKNKASLVDEHINVKFVEILGDTISGKQLIFSIILSVFVSLGGYKLGQYIFPKFAEAQMVNSYSLLLGIAGTVTILIVNSAVFRPKRILVEDEVSSENLREVFQDLQLDYEEELRLIEQDPVTKKELEELGVLSNFNNAHREDHK
ncbi:MULTISPECIES: hypothetical protein [Psychrobacillus]|uniref:Uncharacterized protein n=1 Tax=Psychrobacillus faecigallinarum TaxID=2762235 RepID=A0ABR8RDM7_9BACI|nr:MULTISPECIES: hypothetical protein [Psychrobacillus]MBD7945861.1 hypothetical protein [Psychrobacillus faecigallinarum]QEY22175.1 hypothetical protein D0S48_16705 [Psychrobacillus sp. AK 1817]QGM29056.1 hypothetical protein GI482_00905 [Bacillus sp. N3536]